MYIPRRYLTLLTRSRGVLAFLIVVCCWKLTLSRSSLFSGISSRILTSGNHELSTTDASSAHIIADASHNPLIAISRKQCLQTHVGALSEAFQPVLKGSGILRQLDTRLLIEACRKLEETMKTVGQGPSARVVRSNIDKVEDAYKKIPKRDRGTVIEVLEYEKEMRMHEKGSLQDPSAAVGLLWIRRSLAFQYSLYHTVLNNPKLSTVDAALRAYGKELMPYHGWSLQRIYKIALKRTTPPRREMLCKLGGFPLEKFGSIEEEAVLRDLDGLLKTWKPIITRWKNNHVRLDLEDLRKV